MAMPKSRLPLINPTTPSVLINWLILFDIIIRHLILADYFLNQALAANHPACHRHTIFLAGTIIVFSVHMLFQPWMWAVSIHTSYCLLFTIPVLSILILLLNKSYHHIPDIT
jgi:hypothetical protein